MLDVDEVVSPSAAAAARRRRDRVRPVEALLPPRRRSCRSRGSLGGQFNRQFEFLAQTGPRSGPNSVLGHTPNIA